MSKKQKISIVGDELFEEVFWQWWMYEEDGGSVLVYMTESDEVHSSLPKQISKSGGGGGNRTRVRSRAALATTCVVSDKQP